MSRLACNNINNINSTNDRFTLVGNVNGNKKVANATINKFNYNTAYNINEVSRWATVNTFKSQIKLKYLHCHYKEERLVSNVMNRFQK